MATITLRDAGIMAPRPLFQNLTLTIGIGDRIGLVAGNGAGKTTLLRCIAGRADLDAGDITLSRGACIGLVEQEVPSALLGARPARGGPSRPAARAARPRSLARRRCPGGVRHPRSALRSAHRRPERRLAAAGAAGARLGHGTRRAVAGRADQPPRRREDRLARSLDQRPGRPHPHGDRQPRPRLPRRLHQPHPVPPPRPQPPLCPSLFRCPPPAVRRRRSAGPQACEGRKGGRSPAPQRRCVAQHRRQQRQRPAAEEVHAASRPGRAPGTDAGAGPHGAQRHHPPGQ